MVLLLKNPIYTRPIIINMRKITQDAIKALYENKNFKRGNTEVRRGIIPCLLLHGTIIAKLTLFEGLCISSGGWYTVTTKERLNGLDGVHIYQKDFTWYLNDRQWEGDWVSVEAFTKYGRYLFD
jgi:hypothetical protein